MAKELPAPNPDDPLNMAGAEWAARVEWAKEKIAESGHFPLMPPKPWAGRDEIMASAAELFGIALIDAAGIVDAAVMAIHGVEKESTSEAHKQMMLIRLFGIRRMVMTFIKRGRYETTYKWEKDEETGEVKRVKFKQKVTRGITMDAIGRLLELERNIAELQGLKGPEEGIGTLSLVEELDQILDDKTKRKVQISLAQKIKAGKIENLSPEGEKMLLAALQEKQPPKQIEAEVVEPAEDDEEDEEESEE